MPFGLRTLNDGRKIPEIGFGTWKVPQDLTSGEVTNAFEVGFDHIDTAQVYANEEEVGHAIKKGDFKREKFWLTTKWSGVGGKGPKQSCEESLAKLGVDYIDLYLIHSPRLCNGDIPGYWAQMEELKKEGKVKSIGVSNFTISDLQTLLKHAKIKPVVNQILLHPYVIASTTPLLDYMSDKDIAVEGYSSLIPLTSRPGGPVDVPMNSIASRLGVAPEQVLLAWAKAKGSIIITTSSKKERLERYLAVGDIELTDDDVEAIDRAGKLAESREKKKEVMKSVLKGAAVVGLMCYFVLSKRA